MWHACSPSVARRRASMPQRPTASRAGYTTVTRLLHDAYLGAAAVDRPVVPIEGPRREAEVVVEGRLAREPGQARRRDGGACASWFRSRSVLAWLAEAAVGQQ